MGNFRLPRADEIWEENRLEIFDRIGIKCAITDFAILLGGYVSNNYHIDGGNTLKDRTCWWWSASPVDDEDVRAVYHGGSKDWDDTDLRTGCGRPASFSSLIPFNLRERSERGRKI